MSRWLGFIVGLTIAITVVMTLVRPGQSKRQPEGQDVQLVSDPTPLPIPEPPAPAPATTMAAEQETDPPEPVPEPVTAALVPEPVPEPIPEFRWNAPAEGTQLTPLAEPKVAAQTLTGDTLDSVEPAPVAAPPPAAALTSAQSAAPPAAAAPTSAQTTPPPALPVWEAPAPEASLPNVPARQWYAFWQPFSTEISAKGFSARLERITGLDYRVVKVESGEYHVAFGYEDEESRIANLTAIESATGMRLAGESL